MSTSRHHSRAIISTTYRLNYYNDRLSYNFYTAAFERGTFQGHDFV